MTLHIGVGGAWKEVQPGTAIGVGGANKTISTIHIGVGGAWKQFFANEVFTLTGFLGNTTDGASPYDTTNAIRVGSDGNVYEGDSTDGAALTFTQVNTTNDWIRPTTNAADYFVRYSNVTGTFTSTPGSVNTAIALTSDRTWTLNSTSGGATEVTFDLEILDTDQTTVLAGPTAHRVRCNNI